MRIRIQSLPHSLRRLRRRWSALSRREQGVAAIEFALVAPIMITMYLGMVELSTAFGIDRKNGVLTRTVGDLITQSSSISNSDFDSITQATIAVLSPYPANEVSIRVTSLTIGLFGQVKVDWSSVKNFNRTATALTPLARCSDGASLVPWALRVPSTTIVVTEVKTQHVPVFNRLIGTYDVQDKAYFRPRLSNSIGREGVPTTAC